MEARSWEAMYGETQIGFSFQFPGSFILGHLDSMI